MEGYEIKTSKLLEERDKESYSENLSKMQRVFDKKLFSKVHFAHLCISLCFCALVTFILNYYFMETVKDNYIHINLSLQNKIRKLDEITDNLHGIIKNILYTTSNNTNNPEKFHAQEIFHSEFCQMEISNSLRFDCYPQAGATKELCESRGCCWKPPKIKSWIDQKSLNVPYCYYPANWHIYKLENVTKFDNKISVNLQLQQNSNYGNDIQSVKMETFTIDEATLRIKIYDPDNKRYEPPFPVRFSSESSNITSNMQYQVGIDTHSNLPGFVVHRTTDKAQIFNSIGIGGFIFADQFLQISSLLPSEHIYGLGVHYTKLKLNLDWQILTFFNADEPPTENANLYGSHPFYMVVEESGKCHGILFLNSNGMDIVLQPTPAITFRTIGGIFDIYIFMGPTPQDVAKQYANFVGKPFLPPFWSLGFHLSKFGLKSLSETRELWERTRKARIPYDTQWNDLDYMEKCNDFTFDKNKFRDLPKFIQELHDNGMHYIPLIDAGISAGEKEGTYLPYDMGLREETLVKDGESNEPFKGKVWNHVSTSWPDFTNPKTRNYYLKLMNDTHNKFQFDGAWTDMNEPSNFYNGGIHGCSKNKLDYPPYIPKVNGGLLAYKTLCMNAKHHLGYHYDLHNTYGTSQAAVTNYALTQVRKKRPFIISRSTWVGHGHYAGHWSGDVFSTWHDMSLSIANMLAMNLYQVPMTGSDICGFNGNTTEALCNRWMQLGAFYPFSRNHNSDDTVVQDPVSMGPLVIQSSINSLSIRYSLLSYLYTLFVRAHVFGETVVRPLFFEFTNDRNTYDIDTQFLWGKYLMIIPVLEENTKAITPYFPRGFWYDYYSKSYKFYNGGNVQIVTNLVKIPIYVREGAILPMQRPEVTTTLTRQNPIFLLITLHQNEKQASGELYWDDGDSLDSIETNNYLWITFKVANATLTSSNTKNSKFKEPLLLDEITIVGVTETIHHVTFNNKPTEFTYEKKTSILLIKPPTWNLNQDFVVTWSNKAYPNVSNSRYKSSSVSMKFCTILIFLLPLFARKM